MAGVTLRSNWGTQLLLTFVTRIVENLEPELHFLSFGMRQDAPNGFNTIDFPRVNQFVNADVTTLSEGVNPTAVSWGSTSYQATQTQKGMVVQISDLLVRSSAIETVKNAAYEVRNAVARQLDSFAQLTVNASATATQIIYAGGKSSRASLAAGDTIDPTLITKAVTKLQAAKVHPIGGVYAGIIHPNVSGDLKSNTTVGGFLGFYTNPSDVREHKLGTFRGAAFLDSANVDKFISTVDVYPTTLLGQDAYGWGYFQAPQLEMVNSADSNNPLNLYTSIGMKATIGLTRLQEEKIVRIESAISA